MFMMFRLRSRRASLAAVTAAVGLLITMAPPAWAHGVGVTTNGASTITADADPETPLCLPAEETTITLWNVGGFNDNPGPFDTVATWVSSEAYYFGPGGTYSDDQCQDLTEVLGTLTVTGDVTCDSVAATYQRVTSAYEIETTQSTTCTITGTSNSHTENIKFEGVQEACGGPLADPCDPNGTPNDDSDNVEFTGVYEQGI